MSTRTDDRDGGRGTVLIEGYLRKLKTMKKKFFVLRGESSEASARLEYYDSEKKYRVGLQPKRTISLKTCFNINKRTDTKYKSVIALYTRDDVFCIVMDSDQQLEDWLRILLRLQCHNEEDVVDGEPLKPKFEHMWKVKLQDKGLGDSRNLVGPYYVCLSDQMLSLVKCSSKEEKTERLEFPLTQIRSCGETESFFYIEVGRQSITGAGELWMLTPDANIAKNMNDVIYSAFTLRQNADPHRKRSSSATEANRPTALLQRRQTHGGGRPLMPSPYSAVPVTSCMAPPPSYTTRVSLAPRPASQRRHSVSAVSSNLVATASTSLDVPDGPAALPPGVWHQRTKSCPVSDTSVPMILEPSSHVGSSGSNTPSRRTHTPRSSTGTRERSDSVPTRSRTTSEGTHKTHARPTSVHMRGLSHSPPGPCSTDSAGSSLSIDESDFDRFAHPTTPDERTIVEENADDALLWPNDPEMELERLDTMGKPPTSLSLPIHAVTNKAAGYSASHGSPYSGSPSDYLPMSPADSTRRVRPSCSPSQSDYLPMSPGDSGRRMNLGTSPAAADYLPMSPPESRQTETTSSSTMSDYIAMSPVESHTRTQSASMDYLPMSPGDVNQRGLSRASSQSDYVPMAPHHSDDGYVDMEPASAHRFFPDDHHSDMSPGSSCSVTSGTPSTDQFYLEKVSAYFTPSEEEDASTNDRPARTYSFGSQPKGRLEVLNAAEAARVRAFSVGTRPRPETHKLTARVAPAGTKYPSAPLLSSSWSGSSRYGHDPKADLMEIDFTNKKRNSRLKGLPAVEGLTAQATSSADSGYMDMSSKSPPRASPPRPLSNKHLFSPPEGKSLGVRLIKPAIISSSTLKTIGEKPDIKPQKFPTTSSSNINILPSKLHAPEKPYVEMKGRTSRSGSESKVDGYMDMSFGGSAPKLTRKCSSEHVGDYLSMSCGKCPSQPIAIRGSASSLPSGSRKSSSTTPPKHPTFLPLGPSSTSFNPFSSLGRKNPKRKSRKKQERRGSKENVTTPTAMFPLSLNSPLSPKKAYPAESEGSIAQVATEPSAEQEGTNLAVPLSRVLRICSKENSPISDDVNSVLPDEGDYALMRPGCQTTKWTPPTPKISEESLSRVKPTGRPPSSPRPPDKPPEIDLSKRLAPLAKPEDVRVKPGPSCADTTEPHSGVSRQVSTSSSSSTEVQSVKDGVECDITYASLDLSESEEPRSPRPSPTPGPFTYAEIDFQRSESLRAPKPLNKKIRH